jgi:hypothetical protein
VAAAGAPRDSNAFALLAAKYDAASKATAQGDAASNSLSCLPVFGEEVKISSLGAGCCLEKNTAPAQILSFSSFVAEE